MSLACLTSPFSHGTYFWAVEKALSGRRLGRPCYPHLSMGLNEDDMLVWFQDGKDDRACCFERDDIEAADWEIRA